VLGHGVALADVLPEDPAARGLTIVDASERYERRIFLRGYLLGRAHWIDERRMVTSVALSEGFDARQFDNDGKVVVVDTQTGEVRDTGYSGRVLCYDEGRIFIQKGGALGALYYGMLEGSLQSPGRWLPKGTDLNEQSCDAVTAWQRPADLPTGVLANRRYLKRQHGVLVSWTRQAAGAPLARLYLERPSGDRIDIAFNAGEQIVDVRWIPFEGAYLLVPDLADTQPVKVWEPRFVRLLYPDGRVRRFSVPDPIIDRVKANQATGSAQYTKAGVLWNLHLLPGRAGQEKLNGNYLVIGRELIRVPGAFPAPGGCLLVGNQKSGASTERRPLNDYYFTDICKEPNK
jgi:hypothetical protein